MRLKKLMSVSLCMTMVLSLAGCTFNPKDTISNILNGKGDSTSNANIVASADKVNKDAVFKGIVGLLLVLSLIGYSLIILEFFFIFILSFGFIFDL